MARAKKSKSLAFGGELLSGKRKSKRPLIAGQPLHLVIKSQVPKVFAPGNQSLVDLITRLAAQFDVRLYGLALNWNHLHLDLYFREVSSYHNFVRALTGALATAIRRKFPNVERVFTTRPFTRPVHWGRDFHGVQAYITRNTGSAVGMGFLPNGIGQLPRQS